MRDPPGLTSTLAVVKNSRSTGLKRSDLRSTTSGPYGDPQVTRLANVQALAGKTTLPDRDARGDILKLTYRVRSSDEDQSAASE